MDVEADLIRSQNWPELKRYYASKAGHSWELGWVHLLRGHDFPMAVEQFTRALNDPRYDEAAQILLWRLGKRAMMKPLEGPPSLRLYDALISKRAGPLLNFIQDSTAHQAYIPFIFRDLVEKMSVKELEVLEDLRKPASFSLLLAETFDRKWKDYEKAKVFYEEFLSDPWTRNVLDENRRQVFDEEFSGRLRMAYAQKDGVQIKKALSTAIARATKANSPWSQALLAACEWDQHHLTANILGFPFWKETELSPRALQVMRERLFSKEESPEPPFSKFWSEFFAAPYIIPIPATLDPNSLSLWQIRVEMNPELLSEALLRFPQEERFLFLWSLRQREKAKIDPRRWPADEKESSVVRKSLERAFERSTNKVLWFDRLRASGCSQDFYEYAVQRVIIPIRWVIEDLEKNFISNTPIIRAYLRDQLSLAAPNDSGTNLLEADEFLKAVSFLTPAEKQQVLLSRYVLSEIPTEVVNHEFMELFFEAKARVSPEVFHKWQGVVLAKLAEGDQRKFTEKEWQWVESAWESDPTSLEKFSPAMGANPSFPWETYLERLESSGFIDLLFAALTQIPDERLKESWIQRCLERSLDYRIYKAITSLKTEYIRCGLLADWFERKSEIDRALDQREMELSASPILNDQVRIAKKMIHLVKNLDQDQLTKHIRHLEFAHHLLEQSGGMDENLCRDVSDLFVRSGQYEKAFTVTASQWNRSSLPLKESLLPTLLERAFQARAIESTQRFLVEFLFQQAAPDVLTHEILGVLLDQDSVFRIQHLRKELIEKASLLYPLHREVLKAKSGYDYRAYLLWQSFYGEPLEQRASSPAYEKKRKYELWRLTESVSHVESAAVFSKYLITLPKPMGKKAVGKPHDFLDKAKRLTQRIAKQYGYRKPFEILLAADLAHPLEISFKPWAIELKESFFAELDEEMWSAITLGTLQIFDDYEKGLYDEKYLMERFFQGMLLSGTPIAKLIRLWVWLAISEGIIEPTLLRSEPETLIEKLPLVNSLLIFYLGPDFSQKMDECALTLA